MTSAKKKPVSLSVCATLLVATDRQLPGMTQSKRGWLANIDLDEIDASA